MSAKKSPQKLNTAIGAVIYGAETAKFNAKATDAMVQGMDLFREAAAKLGAVNPKIVQGNLFEYIEAAKFNADVALQNSSLKAVVTAAEGNPHAAADLLIKDGDRVVREVQAKSMNRVNNLTDSLSDNKYQGMQKLVPDGNASQVRELAQKRSQYNNIDNYTDTANNVTDQLNCNGIESGGTSYRENLWAAENSELYVAITEGKYVAQEAVITGANAAIAGFVISGAISGIKNTIAASKGDISFEQAFANTLQDGGKSSLRSGITGAGGTVIRYGATKLGINALSKSNVAVTVAAGVIDIGASVYSFTKGEITSEELITRIGQTGTCTTYSLYVGAAGGAILGTMGAVMGSMAGCLIAASIYQSATAIFQEACLAEAEAKRIIAMCDTACQIMKEQRREFKRLFELNFKACTAKLDAYFAAMNAGLNSHNYELTNKSLGDMSTFFGKKLQFETFAEFDGFMINSNNSLVF
ncbi:MAG: hypothetical protein AAFY63_21240 [Cyanobacteria bacterium J06643_13]